MRKLDSRFGAAALVGAAAIYLGASLATGRSARAEVPPDLTPGAAEAALDVWKTAALLVQEPRTVVLDLRPADAHARYHVPGAVSLPGADAVEARAAIQGAPATVVYAGKDEVAMKVVAGLRASDPGARVHLLPGGARAWYVAFTLPVPLFSDAAPPAGYAEALGAVTRWFATRDPGAREQTVLALQTLAKASYQPELLQGAKKQAAPGGAKKKLAGGCG